MKKQVSSLDVHRLVSEMQVLVGGFLQKAYLPSRAMLVLTFSTKQGKKSLVTLVGRCAYLTDSWTSRVKDGDGEVDGNSAKGNRPGGQPRFAATIRKSLPNAFVTAVAQVGMDRIIRLELQKEVPHSIVIELFGRGNVMVLKEGEIVLPLVTKAWKAREIRHGQQYARPPEGKDPSRMEFSVLTAILRASKTDVARTLAMDLNLGGTYAEEVCLRAKVDGSGPAAGLDDVKANALHTAIRGLFTDLTLTAGGILVFGKDGTVMDDVVPFPLNSYADRRTEQLSTMSGAMERLFAPLATMLEKGVDPDVAASPDMIVGHDAGATPEGNILRLERQLAMQKEGLGRLEAESADNKKDGDTLYLHFKECEDAISAVKEAKIELEEWDGVAMRFERLFIIDGIPSLAMSLVEPTGEKRTVQIDPRVDVDGNARAMYEASKKAREKAGGARKAIEGTLAELAKAKDELDKVKKGLASGKVTHGGRDGRGIGGLRRSKKEFWFERYRWFVSSEGNIVIGGRDARTNEQVVKRYLDDGDRYSHAEVSGAPSVVVKSKDPYGCAMSIDEGTLSEACHFALCLSKAWGSRVGEGNAYWVLPEQVSKQPSTGEFVPRGGFVIRGKRNYVRGMGLELGIGVVDLGKDRGSGQPEERLMCGPPAAVQKHCSRYAMVGPAKGKKSDIARELSQAFGVGMDECERALPPGGSEVRRMVGAGPERDAS